MKTLQDTIFTEWNTEELFYCQVCTNKFIQCPTPGLTPRDAKLRSLLNLYKKEVAISLDPGFICHQKTGQIIYSNIIAKDVFGEISFLSQITGVEDAVTILNRSTPHRASALTQISIVQSFTIACSAWLGDGFIDLRKVFFRET
jgi:hypothetical protein